MAQRPTLLEDLHHMTPSRHLSMLTGRLSQCMTNHQLAAYRGSTLALAMLSLELEVLAEDWLPLTIVLQRMVGVSKTFCNPLNIAGIRKGATSSFFTYFHTLLA